MYSCAFSVNNDLRLAERRSVFDVDELCRLAAQSVGRSLEDICSFVKLSEECHRTFLITMHDGFKMVASVPIAAEVPKYHIIASEVATMRFLHSSGLPVPEVYNYSPSSNNAAKTEYIFMEYITGMKLSDMPLRESEMVSVFRQLVELESRPMSITFPAGGSLYYTKDLAKVAGGIGTPLDERFCIGPDVRSHMWYGKRLQLDVDKGPCTSLSAYSSVAHLGTNRGL